MLESFWENITLGENHILSLHDTQGWLRNKGLRKVSSGQGVLKRYCWKKAYNTKPLTMGVLVPNSLHLKCLAFSGKVDLGFKLWNFPAIHETLMHKQWSPHHQILLTTMTGVFLLRKLLFVCANAISWSLWCTYIRPISDIWISSSWWDKQKGTKVPSDYLVSKMIFCKTYYQICLSSFRRFVLFPSFFGLKSIMFAEIGPRPHWLSLDCKNKILQIFKIWMSRMDICEQIFGHIHLGT